MLCPLLALCCLLLHTTYCVLQNASCILFLNTSKRLLHTTDCAFRATTVYGTLHTVLRSYTLHTANYLTHCSLHIMHMVDHSLRTTCSGSKLPTTHATLHNNTFIGIACFKQHARHYILGVCISVLLMCFCFVLCFGVCFAPPEHTSPVSLAILKNRTSPVRSAHCITHSAIALPALRARYRILHSTVHTTCCLLHNTCYILLDRCCILHTTNDLQYIVAAASCIRYITHFIQHCTYYISYTHTEPHSMHAGYLLLTTLRNLY